MKKYIKHVDVNVRAYGSSLNGLSFENSDLDLCLIGAKRPLKRNEVTVRHVAKALRRSKL